MQRLPETERAEQAQLLRMGKAAYRYYQLADKNISEAYFQHRLAALPPHMRPAMATAGFTAAGCIWAFCRHVLERSALGYAAFMQ